MTSFVSSLVLIVVAYYLCKHLLKKAWHAMHGQPVKKRDAEFIPQANRERKEPVIATNSARKVQAAYGCAGQKPKTSKPAAQKVTPNRPARPANGYGFVNKHPASKNQTVVPIAARFQWSQLPMLSFKSDDAEPMSNVAGFCSIGKLGKDETARHSWESPHEGYLPQIEQDLTVISIDNQTFDKDQLFAKPDAVFFDPQTNEFFVVEYKNRQFMGLHSLFPENVFQLITSALVIRGIVQSGAYIQANGKAPKVRCFIRLENKVTEIVGWECLSTHIWEMAADLIASQEKPSTNATEVAQHFVLFDPVFKKQTDDNDLRCIQGKLKHYRMAKLAQQNHYAKAPTGK